VLFRPGEGINWQKTFLFFRKNISEKASFVLLRRDEHPHYNIPELHFWGYRRFWMGPISMGFGQFLELETTYGSIKLGRCRAFTVICRKYLSLPGHPALTWLI
jgi:hypothetical protein